MKEKCSTLSLEFIITDISLWLVQLIFVLAFFLRDLMVCATCVLVAGSHTSWKVLDFVLKIPGPGKPWKITLVLEIPENYSLGSWKILQKVPWKSCIFFWFKLKIYRDHVSINSSEVWTANIHILLHVEFSAIDCSLNIVCQSHVFFIFKHLRVLNRSCDIFHGGPGKVVNYLSVKRVETLCRDWDVTVAMCSGAKKVSLYEEVLRQVRYVNTEPQELNSRTFVLTCTELNGRFVSNKLETTVTVTAYCSCSHVLFSAFHGNWLPALLSYSGRKIWPRYSGNCELRLVNNLHRRQETFSSMMSEFFQKLQFTISVKLQFLTNVFSNSSKMEWRFSVLGTLIAIQ